MNIESIKLEAKYRLADEAWRKISHRYESYSSAQFLIIFELFIDAYVSGFEEGSEIKEQAEAQAIDDASWRP
jgi:hypothetical protein